VYLIIELRLINFKLYAKLTVMYNMRNIFRIVIIVVMLISCSLPLCEVFEPISKTTSPLDWMKVYLWEEPIILSFILPMIILWIINLFRPSKITYWLLIALTGINFICSISSLLPSSDINILSGMFFYNLLPVCIGINTIFFEKPVNSQP
jgi:hypothetical protein